MCRFVDLNRESWFTSDTNRDYNTNPAPTIGGIQITTTIKHTQAEALEKIREN